MVNNIKHSGGGLALQVTHPSRRAGMVEETDDGEATRLADVFVYGFDSLLLVIDADRVSDTDRADLVSSAASDTDSVYCGEQASLEIAGNGYQVQLPGCRTAGFYEGDSCPVHSEMGLLAIHDGTGERLAGDLIEIRAAQR